MRFKNWANSRVNYLLLAALLLAFTSSGQIPFVQDPDTPMSTHRMMLRAHESELHITKSEWKQLILHLDLINTGTAPLHLIDGDLPLTHNIIQYRILLLKKVGEEYVGGAYLGDYVHSCCEYGHSAAATATELIVYPGESKRLAVQVFKHVTKEPDIGKYNISFYFDAMIDYDFAHYGTGGFAYNNRRIGVDVNVNVIR